MGTTGARTSRGDMTGLVPGSPSPLEAGVAVDGTRARRLERHLCIGPALRAHDGIHRPRPAAIASASSSTAAPLAPPLLAAGGAPLGVCVTLLHVVALVVRAECESVAALRASQRPVLEDHLSTSACFSPPLRPGSSEAGRFAADTLAQAQDRRKPARATGDRRRLVRNRSRPTGPAIADALSPASLALTADSPATSIEMRPPLSAACFPYSEATSEWTDPHRNGCGRSSAPSS